MKEKRNRKRRYTTTRRLRKTEKRDIWENDEMITLTLPVLA